MQNPSKRTDKGAGPSRREVISLQKVDSLLIFLNATGAIKVSCEVGAGGFERKTFKK